MTPSPAPDTIIAPARAGGNFRWIICTLLFFSVALNYIDRTILGIMKDPLSQAFGWGEGDFSNIVAANQIAYAFGYLFNGWLMDKIGIKRGLPLAVLVWSLASAAHGLCAVFLPAAGVVADKAALWTFFTIPASVLGFMACRVVLGLAQGANFPAAIKCVAEWFPQKERSLATGLFNTGSNIGAIVCAVAIPFLLRYVNWYSIFYITGALGVVWLIAWWFLYETPEKHKHLSASERAYILAGQPKPDAAPAAPDPTLPQSEIRNPQSKITWLSLFAYRPVWAYVIAGILAGPVWNTYQYYMPDFLKTQFSLDLQSAGNWTGLFFILAIFGGIVGGWLAGWLLGKGWGVNAARKVTMLVCALAVVPIFLVPFVPAVWIAVVIFGLAGSAHQGWSANLFSFVSDTMPKQTIGAVVGLGGFVTYFTGGWMAKGIGLIKESTGSYSLVFDICALMYVISLLILHLLVPRIQQSRK